MSRKYAGATRLEVVLAVMYLIVLMGLSVWMLAEWLGG